jgi:hypothetical protein
MSHKTRNKFWPALALASSMMLTSASAYAAVDMFLKIEGIEGEAESASLDVELTSRTTVDDILNYAARSFRMNKAELTVVYNGRELDPARTLTSYRIPLAHPRFEILKRVDQSTPLQRSDGTPTGRRQNRRPD